MAGFEDFGCDVCGSSEAVEVPHVREYTNGQLIHICKECGLVYVKKRRSFKEVADVWSYELFGKPGILRPNSYSALNTHTKSRLVYFAEFINAHTNLKGKKVCDIGAGEGYFLDLVRQMGASIFGIEPSTPNCKLMKDQSMECFEGTIEEYMEDAKKHGHSKAKYVPDVVTLSFTLECTQNPANTLKITNSMLDVGGMVAVHTGSRIMVPFKKPLHNFLSTVPMDSHPVQLSFTALKALLAKTGFRVIHHNPFVENDNLCVIAEKMPDGADIDFEKEDYMQVVDFFERWHKESLHYRKALRPANTNG
jgi:2-polyprenyl-3-methyl-5-hydroxy-6-metoxy-1,4-benzoquinol methylase